MNKDPEVRLKRLEEVGCLTEMARLSFKVMQEETFKEIAAEAAAKAATDRRVMEDLICMLIVTGRLDTTQYLDKDLERRQ